VLIITSLFADPWDLNRIPYNQTQFGGLAQEMDITILVPVSGFSVLRNPLAYRRLRRQAVARWPNVDYVMFWHGPRVSHFTFAVLLFFSLLLQRFRLLFLKAWDCILGSWGFPDAVVAVIIGRLTHTPVVIKVQGSDINMFTYKPLHLVQIRWALQQAYVVVAVSKAMAERLAQIGVDPRRTKVLYNGLDHQRFYPVNKHSARRQLGIGQDFEVILFVGILLDAKGIAELLDAFTDLSHKRPLAHLYYVGKGPFQKMLVARVRERGIQERVHFIGAVAHTDLATWYSAASVFCLPSWEEGVPNVVLEAMACGTPVVATDVGGIAEILPRFAGILAPPHDPMALESALHQALNSSWEPQVAVSHSLQFDWNRNIKALKAIVEEAIQQA
jgi:glycosyltransferase involved in cell wall biosynthesis